MLQPDFWSSSSQCITQNIRFTIAVTFNVWIEILIVRIK